MPELEFTGERVVPGQVDADLWNEHYSRYLFAARFARGERVADLGCGAGYGSALLAETAASVVGVDVAADAVAYAREHYQRANLSFEQASCTATGLPDASFDLVTAFEIIEHLADWQALLNEARRLLRPDGQFLVSTPNKLYYGEARQGVANPYHTHEFEFAEFEAALKAQFPSVSLYTQNHVDATVFQPLRADGAPELKIAPGASPVNEAHFYLAICALSPQTGSSAYVYVPTAGNVLREREAHIAKLEGNLAAELAAHRESLDRHQDLVRQHAALQEELERANRWAKECDSLVLTAQETARLAQEAEAMAKARFAEDIAGAQRHLERSEQTVAERTQWAQQLAAENERLAAMLAQVSGSRWMGLGRRLGLGPKLSPAPDTKPF